MIFFKACPRCKGDLYEDKDKYGKFLSCLQCGYLKDLVGPALESEPKIQKGKSRKIMSNGSRSNGSQPIAYSS